MLISYDFEELSLEAERCLIDRFLSAKEKIKDYFQTAEISKKDALNQQNAFYYNRKLF